MFGLYKLFLRVNKDEVIIDLVKDNWEIKKWNLNWIWICNWKEFLSYFDLLEIF